MFALMHLGVPVVLMSLGCTVVAVLFVAIDFCFWSPVVGAIVRGCCYFFTTDRFTPPSVIVQANEDTFPRQRDQGALP
jgi:hypothetical protein